MPGLELQAVDRNPLAGLANAALTDEASAKKERLKELAKLRSRRQAARAKEALAKVPVLEARVAELEAQLKQREAVGMEQQKKRCRSDGTARRHVLVTGGAGGGRIMAIQNARLRGTRSPGLSEPDPQPRLAEILFVAQPRPAARVGGYAYSCTWAISRQFHERGQLRQR